MEWTKFILILGMTILMSYTAFSGLLIGNLPISLSETYYELRRLGKGWIFTAVLLTTALTLMPIWLERTSELWYQFTVFISCAAITFVALSPDYKYGVERYVHYISAYVACGSVVLYHILNGTWIILLICLIPTIISFLWHRDKVSLFAELSLISSVYFSLI